MVSDKSIFYDYSMIVITENEYSDTDYPFIVWALEDV